MTAQEMTCKCPSNESVAAAERTRPGRTYRPAVDISENADGLTLKADLPGVRSEDVDIQLENGTLTLRARTAPRQLKDGHRWLACEYGVGDFERTFQVSDRIDAGRISANMKDGVLTLHLPKVEAAKPRKISVMAQK